MSDVKREGMTAKRIDIFGDGSWAQSPTGAWVSSRDYDEQVTAGYALYEDNERLRAELRETKIAVTEAQANGVAHAWRADRAEARVAVLEKELDAEKTRFGMMNAACKSAIDGSEYWKEQQSRLYATHQATLADLAASQLEVRQSKAFHHAYTEPLIERIAVLESALHKIEKFSSDYVASVARAALASPPPASAARSALEKGAKG